MIAFNYDSSSISLHIPVTFEVCAIYVCALLHGWHMWVQTADSGLASYVAGQIDRSLSWKVW